MTRKTIIPTIALIAILGAIAVGTVTVSAQTPMYDNLVNQIAKRYKLEKADVEDVIDQVRSEHTMSSR